MSPVPLDRRRFLLAGAVACLGPSALAAQQDPLVRARMILRLDAPDGVEDIELVTFSADRRLVALFQTDAKVRIWETATGNWVATLGGQPFDYADLFALVDNGKTVLAWNGTGTGACIAWSVKSGNIRTVFEKVGRNGRDARWASAATADGKRVATVHDGGEKPTLIRGWDVATGKQLWEFNNADGKEMIHKLAFSPDGKTLAAGAHDGKVKLLDAATGKETAVLEGKNEVPGLHWSDDGKRLAVVERGAGNTARVVVWDVATGKTVGEIGPLDRTPGPGGLSPDGKHFAAIHTGGAFAVWDVPSEKPAAVMKVPARRGLAWSADGKSILIVRDDPVIELLVFDLADILPKK